MMPRIYYVNPTDTSDIRATDLNGLMLRDGAVVTLPIDGVDANPRVFQLDADSPPANFDVYPAVEDNRSPPQYYTYDPALLSLTFAGTAGVSGTVTEDRTPAFVQLPIDDLRDRKYDEGESYSERVAFSSAQATLDNGGQNIFILTDTIQLFGILLAGAFYGDRLKDRTLGKDSALGDDAGNKLDPLNFWVRNVRVQLVNSVSGNRLQANAVETEWGQVIKDIGVHIFQTADARNDWNAAVETAHAGGVWQTLADLDVTDQVYGWPPFYDGPVSRTVRTIR